MENIYYDRFTDEYVTKKSVTAPPERYFKIIECHWPDSLNNSYVEHWYTKDGRKWVLAYNKDELENSATIRRIKANYDEVDLSYLYRLELPPDEYQEIRRCIC